MGQRANLVVITTEGAELYYSHWAANTLDADLFWGAAYATAFARKQRSEAEGAEWLDDVWSEGGAVIDHTQKLLLWYGGEDVLFDVPRRRQHLALMQTCWRGWELRWACEGILELARHVGVAKNRVSTAREPRRTEPVLAIPERRDGIESVLTVVDRGTARVIPLRGHPGDLIRNGMSLVAAAREARGLPRLDYAEWSECFPLGGVHVDVDRKRAGFWLAKPLEDAALRAAPLFDGVHLEWWRDAYEPHLAAAGDILTFPPSDPARHVRDISEHLLRDSVDRGQALVHTLEALHKAGSSVSEVNAWALRDDPGEIPLEVRVEMLARAIAEWNATSGQR